MRYLELNFGAVKSNPEDSQPLIFATLIFVRAQNDMVGTVSLLSFVR